MEVRPAVLTALVCVAVGLALGSGDGDTVVSMVAPEVPSPTKVAATPPAPKPANKVGAEVHKVMKAAADVVKKQAVDEATKANAKVQSEIDMDPVALGIPREVIEALSDANMISAVRKALETMALDKVNNQSAVEQKVNKELNARVAEATKLALSDPIVNAAKEKAVDDLSTKEAKQVEAESHMRDKVEKTLENVVDKAEGEATEEAKGVLQQAQKKAALLSSLEGTVSDPESSENLAKKLTQAEDEAKQAKEFVDADKKKEEDAAIQAELKRVMEEEDRKLKAEAAAEAERKVQAELTQKAALEAERKLREAAEKAEKVAKEKAEKKKAEDRRLFIQKTAEVSAQEGGAFTQKVELGREQGYWTARRRFAAQKHFVKHGKLDHDDETSAERDEDQEHQEQAQKREEAKEETDGYAAEKQSLEEDLKQSVPKGSITKLVKKAMQAESMKAADTLADKAVAKVEENQIDEVVGDVVKDEVQNPKPKPTPKSQSDAPPPATETEDDDETEVKVEADEPPSL